MNISINLVDAMAVWCAAKKLVEEQGISYGEAVSTIQTAAVLGIDAKLLRFKNELLRSDDVVWAEINNRLGKM